MKYLLSLGAALLATNAFANYTIEVKELVAQSAIVAKATSKTQEEVGQLIPQLLAKVIQFAQEKQLTTTGKVFSRYFKYEPGTEIVWEAGITLDKPATSEGEIEATELPAGPAATTVHVGSYEQVGGAYDALHAWVTANNKIINGGVYEVYVNDPSIVKPEEYKTEVVFPIK